jgi:general secretion pathway protein E
MTTIAAETIGPARLRAVGTPEQPPLCGLLVDCGKLETTDVDRALRLQREQDDWERIGSILVKLGLVSEKDVAESLSTQLKLELVDRTEYPDERPNGTDVTARFLKKNKALILDEDDDTLSVVMADPLDDYVIDALKLRSGKAVRPRLGVPSEIEYALEQLYDGSSAAAGSADTDVVAAQYLDDVEQLKELAGEAPVIKLVNQLIHRAAETGASDIHIEPFEGQLKVRYRVDGLLREVDSPPMQSAAAVISRVKIMANLNIAERRLAQDGRFKQRVRGVEYDLRVSTVPTMYGESVVMRLLQRDAVAMDFVSLGFNESQVKTMHDVLATPHGILLVTGPTGSGKSTTLYAALTHLNQPERMIITVEDPVEYNIRGINQMQVKPQIGLTFANALRSIVRQDPDVIMIGEMRDTETAQIAVQSALTGHLVLSTLHTNDAAGSVMRLLDMGVQDYLLTSAVTAIQAQRLVRTLCTDCREEYTPIDEVIERWGLDRFAEDGKVTLHKPVGCDSCGGTGYTGRLAILEILMMSNEIRDLVLKRCDVGDIARLAAEQGMVTMRDDGLQKAVAGLTTIEEVLRVTPEPASSKQGVGS